MDSVESTIKTYSGISSETKPTISGGTDIPNGSRFREVDTATTYFFNLKDDSWYCYSGSSGDSITDGETKKQLVQDNTIDALLTCVLKELKKINIHMALITDSYITNSEVD